MKTARSVIVLSFIGASVLLGGCSNVRESLGFERGTPDEFNVVPSAGLEVPQGVSLPPPTPGAQRPQQVATSTQAQQAVFGSSAGTGSASVSGGEQALLSSAGNAEPGIRQIVEQETRQLILQQQTILTGILTGPVQSPDPLVDPAAEARRIAAAQAAGTPLNQGEVPIIEPSEEGPLAGLFDTIFEF
ncbi:MAG: DUF3035 domain-containing protein [Azospirillaceae bacterium]